MLSYNEKGVVGSFLEPIPVLYDIEHKFDSKFATQWLHDNRHIPVLCSIVYLALVYTGSRWMKSKEPYILKNPLLLWNIGLAVFSLFGMLSLLPSLIHGVLLNGVNYAICHAESSKDPHLGLWGFVFVLSKIFEFIDTLFLVLRKKPLSFLHWYHHTSVLVYSWLVLGSTSDGSGLFFAAINFFVHTLMYSYYFLRAMSVSVPSSVALLITILQIAQMFIGLAVNGYLFYHKIILEETCICVPSVIYIGLIVYGSYTILFIKFFLSRYVWKDKKKQN